MRRVSRMEHAAARLDSLERSLGQLQQRYDQVRAMMGADSNAQVGAATIPRSLTPMPATTPRLGTPVSPDMDAPGVGVAGARAAVGPETTGGVEVAPDAATAVADPTQPDAQPLRCTADVAVRSPTPPPIRRTRTPPTPAPHQARKRNHSKARAGAKARAPHTWLRRFDRASPDGRNVCV